MARRTSEHRVWTRAFVVSVLLGVGCGGHQQTTESPGRSSVPIPATEVGPVAPTRVALAERWSASCLPPVDSDATNFCGFFDAVTLDDGSLVLAGMLHGRVEILGRTLKSRGMQNALVVKVSARGDLVWARRFGRTWHNQAHHIEPGPEGTFVIAGIAANGLHPSLEKRTRPKAWENERPFVAVLDADGKMLAARDLEQHVKDLRAHAGDVWVAGTEGLVERLAPNLESMERREYDADRPYTYEVRLDDGGGLWAAFFEKRDGGADLHVSRFRPSQRPVHVALERPTRDIDGVTGVAYEEGLVLATSETRELVRSEHYPKPGGGLRIAKPGKYEMYIHWWSIDADGGIRWHHEEQVATGPLPESNFSPLAVLERDGTILTHVASEGGLRIAGESVVPPSRRGGQFGFVVAMDASDGRVTEILEPQTSCNRTGLHKGTGDLLIRNLFTTHGDDLLVGTSTVPCEGRSTQVATFSPRTRRRG